MNISTRYLDKATDQEIAELIFMHMDKGYKWYSEKEKVICRYMNRLLGRRVFLVRHIKRAVGYVYTKRTIRLRRKRRFPSLDSMEIIHLRLKLGLSTISFEFDSYVKKILNYMTKEERLFPFALNFPRPSLTRHLFLMRYICILFRMFIVKKIREGKKKEVMLIIRQALKRLRLRTLNYPARAVRTLLYDYRQNKNRIYPLLNRVPGRDCTYFDVDLNENTLYWEYSTYDKLLKLLSVNRKKNSPTFGV